MPLIIATNAYVTHNEADAYFSEQLQSSGWNAAICDAEDGTPTTDPATLAIIRRQEAALIAATAAVDRLGFKGAIAAPGQGLAWPRVRMRDREGRAIASDTVPDIVKAATCEYARHLLNNPKATEHAPAVSQKRVGDLEIRYRATSPDPVPLPVRQLLAPFLAGTPHSVEIVP